VQFAATSAIFPQNCPATSPVPEDYFYLSKLLRIIKLARIFTQNL